MAMWVKYEKRKVTQYVEGAIYKTKLLGVEWYDVHSPECPQDNHVNEDDIMWSPTTDIKFQKDKPE